MSDYKRKIVRIAPSTFLAAAGSESTFYAARILRNCLYNNGTEDEIRKSTLELFSTVNKIYKETNYHQPVSTKMEIFPTFFLFFISTLEYQPSHLAWILL